MRKFLFILFLLVAGGGGYFAWQRYQPVAMSNELILYGNVDLRQVDLAFRPSERIARVLVEEGEVVSAAQELATLQTPRLQAALDRAKARMAAQQHALERLEHGTRPEEIAQARANVAVADADLANAQDHFDRDGKLLETHAVSQQAYDDAKAALNVAKAKLQLNQKALDLAVAGPRQEDIDEACSMLAADQADVASAQQDLDDAVLRAPSKGIIRSRVMEPGDMASPQKTVFVMAVTDPKWVRAYIPEPLLGRVRLGDKCAVTSDAFAGRHYRGWIGFISPMAEFTPKSVETTELRTQLVYEVRVFVTDPTDDLRLGMPATVRVEEAVPTTVPAHPSSGQAAAAAASTESP